MCAFSAGTAAPAPPALPARAGIPEDVLGFWAARAPATLDLTARLEGRFRSFVVCSPAPLAAAQEAALVRRVRAVVARVPRTRAVRAELWLTPGRKRAPARPRAEPLRPLHVNSGLTILRREPRLLVYRAHEWPKVLLHECVHAFGLDAAGGAPPPDLRAWLADADTAAALARALGSAVPAAWLRDTERAVWDAAANEGLTEALAEWAPVRPGAQRAHARAVLAVLRQTWARVAHPDAPAPQTPVLGYLVLKAAVAAALLSGSEEARALVRLDAARAGLEAWLRALRAQLLRAVAEGAVPAAPRPAAARGEEEGGREFRLWADTAHWWGGA